MDVRNTTGLLYPTSTLRGVQDRVDDMGLLFPPEAPKMSVMPAPSPLASGAALGIPDEGPEPFLVATFWDPRRREVGPRALLLYLCHADCIRLVLGRRDSKSH